MIEIDRSSWNRASSWCGLNSSKLYKFLLYFNKLAPFKPRDELVLFHMDLSKSSFGWLTSRLHQIIIRIIDVPVDLRWNNRRSTVLCFYGTYIYNNAKSLMYNCGCSTADLSSLIDSSMQQKTFVKHHVYHVEKCNSNEPAHPSESSDSVKSSENHYVRILNERERVPPRSICTYRDQSQQKEGCSGYFHAYRTFSQ